MINPLNFGFILIVSLASTLHVNAQMHLESGNDVSLTRHGYLRIGAANSINLAFDNNEIQSRNNGMGSSLFFNLEGGVVQFGGNASSGRVNMQRYSTRGNRNIWVDNDGFLNNEKREKIIHYPYSSFRSKDTEKDFIYGLDTGLRAKNNRDDTQLLLPIVLPVGSEITSIEVTLSDGSGNNNIYAGLLEYDGKASAPSFIKDSWSFSNVDPCGISCYFSSTLESANNILVEEDRMFVLRVANYVSKEWLEETRVWSAKVTYLEP